MFVAARQHGHLTRVDLLNVLTVSACFVIAFILMISGVGLWLIDLIEPQHHKFVPTLLALTSFSLLGVGTHITDLIERRERQERFGGTQPEPAAQVRENK